MQLPESPAMRLHYPGWEAADCMPGNIPFWMTADLPDWYKSALFNELYYVVEGGVFLGLSGR